MAKPILKTVLTLLTILITLANLFFTVWDNTAYSLEGLPTGKLYKTDGIDKPYFVSIYIVEAGGTLGTAVRAEATEMDTGKTYTVYWETDVTSTPLYSRISDTEFDINGHVISLTPDGVHYDSRTEGVPTLFDKK